MIAWFGPRAFDLILIEKFAQLMSQSAPVGAELLYEQGLLDAGTEPEVHVTWARIRSVR